MKTLAKILAGFAILTLAACSVAKSNSFIGYWVQARLSDHPLGMGLCGNYQNIEFLENGTFILTNDFSGVYKPLDFSDASKHPRSLQGTYTILNKNQIELVFEIDDQSETWNYVFSGDDLTMSFNPIGFPDETGGGDISCYFTRSK